MSRPESPPVRGRAPRARAPRVSADVRRQEIILAAHEVFGARGFHKASLGEIAERVGITHQGILHHFGSKEQLFVEVLIYREHLDVADFENHEPPRGPEMLRHLVKTAVVNTGRIGLVQSYVVLSAESVTDGHPAQTSFRERFEVLRGLIAAALEACCEPDAMPSAEELSAGASSIIAVMDGLQVQWLLDPDAVQMPAAVGLVIDALLEHWGSTERASTVLS
ncbi:TetR/AcrR family transcriptional regulator [Nocardioides sp. T2.26MG-1]|uniref:TetR/AcrR family transcriptional regulator n=1 Tax=Nocardioides sp. T2.26MG-1 TaxID=3041166 RepID=UPI0024774FE3|nr:TetR/AcrR family transcriptional regulator [Nocardioides sp. T2.26MG-1]CAI9406597.1 HTH-type transcriptional regulator AcrR [Nocardioides sp. T2.26MG-1]